MFVLRLQKSYCFCVVLQGVLDATKAVFNTVCPEDDGGSWMKKLISFRADAASVNMHHRAGVIALLQRAAVEYIIIIIMHATQVCNGKNWLCGSRHI